MTGDAGAFSEPPADSDIAGSTRVPPAEEWHYAIKGIPFGPVSEEQLVALAREGRFQPTDFVYADYIGTWVRADSVHGLFDNVLPYGVARQEPIAAPDNVPQSVLLPGPGAQARRMDYPGLWIRFVAVFVDGLLLKAVVVALSLVSVAFDYAAPVDMSPDVLGAVSIASTVLMSIILPVLAGWLYFGLLESSRWQATIGKRLVGVIVTDTQGNRITFPRASGRYFASILSTLTIYIGYIIAAFTPRKQTLHDLIAGTVVIWGKTGV